MIRDNKIIKEFIFKIIKKSLNRADKDISDKIGITLSNFNQIKNGHVNPNIFTFSRMCVEFNLSKQEIFEIISDLAEVHRKRNIVERGAKRKKWNIKN